MADDPKKSPQDAQNDEQMKKFYEEDLKRRQASHEAEEKALNEKPEKPAA